MKKVAVLVLVLIIFNFICSNYYVYAETEPPTEPAEPAETQSDTGSSAMSLDEYKKIAEEGKVSIGASDKNIELSDSEVGSSTSKIGSFLSSIAAVCSRIVSEIAGDGGYYYYESDNSAKNTGVFTINSLIFGEYVLFNAKPYQTSSDLALDPDYTPSGVNALIDFTKERASTIGHFVARVSLLLAVPMFLFSIVKTIFAQTAKDLAAWRKILVRWALCVFLMIFFEYIFAIIDQAAGSLVDVFWNMRIGLEESGYHSFEITTMENIAFQFENTGGVISLAYALEYVLIVVLQILFLVKYAIRVFGTTLIFMIMPVIVLLHSVRLMLGKESDTLGELFKIYIALVFMQPLHALFYLIFFFSLSEMAVQVPIIGIILLYALYRAGNIAKAMFGFELSVSSIFSKK